MKEYSEMMHEMKEIAKERDRRFESAEPTVNYI